MTVAVNESAAGGGKDLKNLAQEQKLSYPLSLPTLLQKSIALLYVPRGPSFLTFPYLQGILGQ